MRHRIAALVIPFVLVGCAATRPEPGTLTARESVGVASYYASRFHGRRTANGEDYDETAFTAAHKYLPFGTRVRVTNLSNERSVVVRINDRGPWRPDRVIDLSRRAARQIGLIGPGTATVRLSVVDP